MDYLNDCAIPNWGLLIIAAAALALAVIAYFCGVSEGYDHGYGAGERDGAFSERQKRGIDVEVEIREGRDSKWGAFIAPRGEAKFSPEWIGTHRSQNKTAEQAIQRVKRYWPDAKVRTAKAAWKPGSYKKHPKTDVYA